MVEAFESDHLVCELEANLEGPRFKPGYYDGALITGEDQKAVCRVVRVEGNKFYTDRLPHAHAFPDADEDGRQVTSVYDFGPGDQVTLPQAVFVRREPDGTLTSRGLERASWQG